MAAIIQKGKRDPERERQANVAAKVSAAKAKHKGKKWDHPSVRDEIIEVVLIQLGLIDADTKQVIG